MIMFMTALASWLHSLATVILVGHYLLLTTIYLPAFMNHQTDPVAAPILSEISKRSRPWLYASLTIFMITGIYITAIDSNYLGLGDFGNIWSILMLVKHVLIVGMILIGFWFNAILRVGPQLMSRSGAHGALLNSRKCANLMTIANALVLLLTAISQAQ